MRENATGKGKGRAIPDDDDDSDDDDDDDADMSLDVPWVDLDAESAIEHIQVYFNTLPFLIRGLLTLFRIFSIRIRIS